MHVTPTIIGNMIQTYQYLDLPYVADPITTLNTKHDIIANETLPNGEIPRLKYLVIGNGGHRATVGTDNLAVIKNNLHRPRDTGLFSQIPFILRPAANDIPEAQQAKYRLRKKVTYNGKDYIAYYMRVIDFSDSTVKAEYVSVTDGNMTTTDFKFTVDDLSPTPTDYANNQVITADGNYVSVSAITEVKLTEEEINEIIDACTIIYGSADYAVISELGLVTGVDISTPNTTGVGAATVTECACAQIATFFNRFYKMETSTDYLIIDIQVGDRQALVL